MSNLRVPFQLPTQKGTEVFPDTLVPPTIVRTVVVLQPDVPPGEHVNILAAVERIMDKNRGVMLNFYRSMMQNHSLGIVQNQRNTRSFEYGTMQFAAMTGITMLTVTIYPELFMEKVETEQKFGGWDFFSVVMRWKNEGESGALDLDPRFRLETPALEPKTVGAPIQTQTPVDYMGFEMHPGDLYDILFYGGDMTEGRVDEKGEEYGNEGVYVDLREVPGEPEIKMEVRAHWYDIGDDTSEGAALRALAFQQELFIYASAYRGGEMKKEDEDEPDEGPPEAYRYENTGYYDKSEKKIGKVYCTEDFDPQSASPNNESTNYPGQMLGYVILDPGSGAITWEPAPPE